MALLLAKLAGFVVGAAGAYLLAACGLWLALGAPSGDQSGLVMLMAVPVALLIGLLGGFFGMRLAGKWVKALSHDPTESRKEGTRD